MVTIEDVGWITLSKPGEEEAKLEPPPMLEVTFDLKVHTAASLSKALKTKQAAVKLQTATKRKGGALPSSPVLSALRCAPPAPSPATRWSAGRQRWS